MEEQPSIKKIVDRLLHQGVLESTIVEILISIIHQQMLYGGSLEDKINYNLKSLIEKY
jgi:hypothetical protein